jgi:hypothetical protein
MVEADLQALGLTSPRGKDAYQLDDNAYIRRFVGSMVD